MSKKIINDVVPFNFAQEILNPKVEKRTEFDYNFETIDEGWIYELLPDGTKGKKLRKFLERFRFGPKGMRFWKPRINDLKKCETQRWKAVQYKNKQLNKIIDVFQKILDNRPFCCVRIDKNSPNYSWVVFKKLKGSTGISWEYWKPTPEAEKPDCELRQDIGDEWFNYETRSQLIGKRVYYFQNLFMMAIALKYEDALYNDEFYKWGQKQKKIVINDREYIIGMKGGQFDVLVFPEDVDTEVIN